MKILFKSPRSDSSFHVVENDDAIFLVALDEQEGEVWGKYEVTEPETWNDSQEIYWVSPDGDVEIVRNADYDVVNGCVNFGEFEFDDSAESIEDLF